MRHNKIIYFFSLTFIISSCQSPQGTYTYYTNGTTKSWEYIYPKGSDFLLKRIEYYRNGTKKSEGNLNVTHNKEGIWYFWYDNGNIWVIENFKNNLSEGKAEVFRRNGKRSYIAYYKHGKPEGVWTFFDSTDTPVKKIWFKNGKKVSEKDL